MQVTDKGYVQCISTLEEFENGGLFLPLGLHSTLIRHEYGAFRKRSSNRRNLKTPALRFSVDKKHFENEAFRKWWRYDDNDIPLPKRSYSKTNVKWLVIAAFSNSSSLVRTENIWCVFIVRPPFLNSFGVVRTYLKSRLLITNWRIRAHQITERSIGSRKCYLSRSVRCL